MYYFVLCSEKYIILLKSDTIQKIKFFRKKGKLFFNLTENY